jgi:hypothetical protein
LTGCWFFLREKSTASWWVRRQANRAIAIGLSTNHGLILRHDARSLHARTHARPPDHTARTELSDHHAIRVPVRLSSPTARVS